MRRLALYVAILSASAVPGQSFKKLHYVDEIGHLGTPQDSRKLANLGFAKANPADGDTRFEGVDDAGHRWRATIPTIGGIGWTDVWRADFDANGHLDLMISAVFPGNGRCVNHTTITFLMFDTHSRPVPWTIETELPKNGGPEKVPALIREVDGHAEFVATGCEYSTTSSDEIRSVKGIYAAESARWKLFKPPDLTLYERMLSANYASRYAQLLKPDPSGWVDRGNESRGGARLRIVKVLPADPKCRGIVHLEIVDGLVRVPNDGCDVLGQNRLELSDGRVCFNWPTVVIDRPAGREIFQEGSSTIEAKLKEIASGQLPVTLLGETDRGRCSPTQLWTAAASH